MKIPEETMLEAIMFGHDEIKRLIAFQEKIVSEIGKDKIDVVLAEVDPQLDAEVRAFCETEMIQAIQVQEKHAREDAIKAVKDKVIVKYEEQEAEEPVLKQVKQILDKLVKGEVRRLITVKIKSVRMDVKWMKFVHYLQKLVYYLEHTVQVCLHVDKLKL